MGLKSSKILFKAGAKNMIYFIMSYLESGTIPMWIMRRHSEMMKK